MEWNIEYVKIEDYLKITLHGSFSIDKYPAFFKDLLTYKHWQPGITIFFDFRHFDFGQIITTDVRAASDRYQEIGKQFGNSKVALLMKSPLDFAHGRQFEMLSEDKGELQICVFREEDKALNWLLDKKAVCQFFAPFQQMNASPK